MYGFINLDFIYKCTPNQDMRISSRIQNVGYEGNMHRNMAVLYSSVITLLYVSIVTCEAEKRKLEGILTGSGPLIIQRSLIFLFAKFFVARQLSLKAVCLLGAAKAKLSDTLSCGKAAVP